METKAGARGFTLIELVIAVGLIGVMLALAVPAYNGWRERVRNKQAVDDINAMSLALDQRLQDTGTLPASLADIGRGGLADPWGRPYRYLPLNTPASRGQARKDHSLVPINTDYDLYSTGPDGRTAPPLTARFSRDDIVRANNGRFVGVASDY